MTHYRYVRIAVDPSHHEALQAKTAWHARRLRQWWQEQCEQARNIDDPQERRQALAELYADRRRRRKQGLWWDSQAAIIAWYLRANLDRRGWMHRQWRRIPHDHHRLPGRRWGTPNHPPGSGPARLTVTLPDDLHEVLQRATWNTSRRSVADLQEWMRRHHRPYNDRESAELAQLQNKIINPGTVLREVIAEATADWFPFVSEPAVALNL